MLFDLHVHTEISECSRLKISDILNHAKDKGLDGVCITDHQTMDIRHYNIREGFQKDGLLIIFGMEYETVDGDFLIFGPFENIRIDLPAKELLKFVKKAGGVAVAAHPFRRGRSVSEYIVREKHCKIIETMNGRNSNKDNKKTDIWLKTYDLKSVGGSDAHTLEELGKVKIDIKGKIIDRNSFIDALKNNPVRLV